MAETKRTSTKPTGSIKSLRRPRALAATSARSPLGRRDILDRAARLMQQKGYGGISAQHIADALDFSKANLFYHVKTKEHLLYQIIVENLRFAIRHYEEILRRKATAAEKLRALIDFYVQLMTEHGAVIQVWYNEKNHLTPEHFAEVTRLERRIQKLQGKFYSEAIRRGEFRGIHPGLASISMFGMCFTLTRWPELSRQLSRVELTNSLQSLACVGLLREDK